MTGYKDIFHGYNEHFFMVPECSLLPSSTVCCAKVFKATDINSPNLEKLAWPVGQYQISYPFHHLEQFIVKYNKGLKRKENLFSDGKNYNNMAVG